MTTNDGMRELLSVINKLQDAFSVSGLSLGALDLPQIAVVGGQSAGKSSVLENFVGRDFLPRGSGIVTRRPLVLQLHPNKEEYAEFLHKPNEKFKDFDAVRREIEEETDRITGKNKGISDVPINLRIYSPHVLDLTLVDLPGITKIPVGDQPQDIENQIRNMILRFISLENTLILAVSPANSDLANSDALKLAKEVDPDGRRTIGVLTKLDLMDQGTDARDILENKIFPLSRGYVGLVNRSQRDIDSRKDIWAAQEAEMEFFRNHEAYSHMIDKMGSKYLQEILNQQLHDHIKEKLPYLRSTVKQQHKKTHDQLAEMNAFDESSEGWRQKLFIKLVNDFADEIKTSVLGNDVKVENSELTAGAKINICFYSTISNLLASTGNLSEEELAVIIKNLHGIGNTLFTPELAFTVGVGKLVEKYNNPIIQSVDLVSDILVQAVNHCSRHFQDYPRLKDEVLVLVNDKIKQFEERAKKHLKIHINAQVAFMNTKHPDFHRITSPQQIPKDFKGLQDGSLNIAQPPTSIIRTNSNESIAPSAMGFPDSVDSATMTNRSLSYTPAVSQYSIASRPPGTAGYPIASGQQSAIGSPQVGQKKYEIMNKGWMMYHQSGIGRKTKQYWFVLHSYAMSWYKDETERDMIGTFSLENVKMIRTSSKKYNRFSLQREGKSKDSSKLELSCRNDIEEETWVAIFEKSGVMIENTSDLTDEDKSFTWPSTDSKKSSFDVTTKKLIESDPELRGEKDVILFMIHSYMNIVHKTVNDLIPKYIVLLLVKETLEFTSKALLGELMCKDDWSHFLETSTEETKKKNELFRIYEATKKAIAIMNEVSQDL